MIDNLVLDQVRLHEAIDSASYIRPKNLIHIDLLIWNLRI